MAYTKSPSVSTYDTKRLDFVQTPQQRSGLSPTKDARLMNMMVEVIKNPLQQNVRTIVISRGGVSLTYTTQAGAGRGVYYWIVSGVGYSISVVGNKIYSNSTVLSTTLAGSTGLVGFTEHVSSAGVVTLFMADGTDGYVFTSPTLAPTKVVDVNFPTPHIPAPQFMDGYLFLAKASSEDIYNCLLDTPLTWTISGSAAFISAEMYPDKIVTLSKNNNYIYAVGSNSVEYFYDAGNATGSPLQRQTPAVQQFGTAAADSVVQTEEEVIMIGETQNGGHTVWTINGFKAKEVGNHMVKATFLAEGSSLANCTAYSIRVSGQKLYIVNLTSRTLVYSFDTDMWTEWSSGASGTSAFIGYLGTDGPNGSAYLQDISNGNIYSTNENIFTDNGSPFLCQIVTPKEDFGTFNQKFASRLSLIGDIPDSSGTNNTILVSWSDDDYNTWVTDRNLSFNNDFPAITQLGRFRRRAFRFKYSLPQLLRLDGFEVDINKGDQ